MMSGHLYVFGAEDGTVKIGISTNPVIRRSQIEAASGRTILREFVSPEFAWYKHAEKYLHGKFAQYRLKGEWFCVPFDEAVSAANLVGISMTTGEWCNDARYISGVEARDVYIKFMDGDPSDDEITAFLIGFGPLINDMDHASMCDINRATKELVKLVNDSALIYGDSVIVAINKIMSEKLDKIVAEYKPILDLAANSQ